VVAVVAGGGTPRLDAQCLIPRGGGDGEYGGDGGGVKRRGRRRNGCAPSVVDGASSLRAISRGVSTSVATSNSVGSRERRRTLQESIVKNKKREQSSNS
jgi:hypothetical protein